MLNENAKKWVAALRSGKYKQGRRRLRTDDRFCCLGVACELAVMEGVTPRGLLDGQIVRYSGQSIALPDAVLEWLGLGDQAGRYSYDQYLTNDNDRGATFAEIADIIESEPEGLFR